MEPDVTVEGALLAEALPTLSTEVGFFSCVDSLVEDEVLMEAEALAALSAGERLLASVNTVVKDKVGFSGAKPLLHKSTVCPRCGSSDGGQGSGGC